MLHRGRPPGSSRSSADHPTKARTRRGRPVGRGAGLRRLLESRGHEVHIGRDGPSAIEAAASEQRSETVLVNASLPGMDSDEVARRLRDRLAGEVRIALLIGFRHESDRRAPGPDIDRYLIKSVESEALRGLLEP